MVQCNRVWLSLFGSDDVVECGAEEPWRKEFRVLSRCSPNCLLVVGRWSMGCRDAFIPWDLLI